MNSAARARCQRLALIRLGIALTPLVVTVALMASGHGIMAALVFVPVGILMTLGTVMPRCALFGRMIKDLPPGSDKLLLTIDDGPHPEHTPLFLDVLDQHGIKAVFFLIGERAARHPDLVREIVRRGHELGNHTQTHPAGTFWSLRPAALWREVDDCQKTLTSICPEHPPRFFRPPAGHHNLFTFAIVQSLGLRMMLWSVRGFDGVLKDVNAITHRIQQGLKPGAIVLIHEATPVAADVVKAVAPLLGGSGLDCGSPPRALEFAEK